MFSLRDWCVPFHLLSLYIAVDPKLTRIGHSIRQVCKRFKKIIDSSIQLQLLIELYRDDLYLDPQPFNQFPWRDGALDCNSITRTQGFRDMLQSQLRSREGWETFNPDFVKVSPPEVINWTRYKINNGYLGFCSEVAVAGTYRMTFKNLRDPTGNEEDRVVLLAKECDSFAFDLSEDLLITTQYARRPNGQEFVHVFHRFISPAVLI